MSADEGSTCAGSSTEAVGEGATLVDKNGYRFMKDYHADLELAPRRRPGKAIVEQIRKTHFTHVYLDVRHLPTQSNSASGAAACRRCCDQFDINVAKDADPHSHPATHYMIGGVDADLSGRSTLPGLYAIGEASRSGLHGANRLASNSLLEGMVFGTQSRRRRRHRSQEKLNHFPPKARPPHPSLG